MFFQSVGRLKYLQYSLHTCVLSNDRYPESMLAVVNNALFMSMLLEAQYIISGYSAELEVAYGSVKICGSVNRPLAPVHIHSAHQLPDRMNIPW